MQLTDQSVRARALNTSHSFIVQAPAGSGKTHLLVQRFLALLAQSDHIENTLAITFTKKAAEEMKERILQWLSDQSPDQWLKKIQKQIKQKGWDNALLQQNLQVMTIDSLCYQIVSLNQRAPDIHPYPEILYQQAIDHFLRDDSHLNNINSIWQWCGGDPNRLSSAFTELLRERVGWAYHLLQQQPSSIIDYTNQSCERLAQWAVSEFIQNTELVSQISHFLNALKAVHTHSYPLCDISNSANDWQHLANWLLTKKGSLRKRLTLKHGMPNKSMIDDQTHSELHRLWQELRTDLGNNLLALLHLAHIQNIHTPFISAQQETLLMAIRYLAPHLLGYLHTVFSEQLCADFSEILIQARSLLVSDPSIQEKLYNSCHHLLIDECQDTSPAQFDLIHALTKDWDNSRTLFLVGDPQQSIYKFRYADVRQFLHIQQHGFGEKDIEPLSLTNNLRSAKKLIDDINIIFTQLFSSKQCINYGLMRHHKSHAVKKTLGGLYTCWHNAGPEQTILDIIKNTAPDKDVCILVRKRSQAYALIHLLNTHAIPFNAPDMFPSKQHGVFSDLLSLSIALLDASDKLAWYSVLTNAQTGMTLADLTSLENNAPLFFDHTFFKEATNNPHLDKDAMQFWADLIGLCQDNPQWPIGQKIWQCAHHLGWLAQLEHNLISDIASWCHLLNELNITRGMQLNRHTLTQIAGKQLMSKRAAHAQVHIMTIHHAKGLEFDTVIAPYLDQYQQQRDTSATYYNSFFDSDGLFSLMIPKQSWSNQEHRLDWYRWIDKCQAEQEQKRLLYVAMTRAKSRCIVMGQNNPAPQSWAGSLQHIHPQSTIQEVQCAYSNTQKTHLSYYYPRPTPQRNAQYEWNEWIPHEDDYSSALGTVLHDILYRFWQNQTSDWTSINEKYNHIWKKIVIDQGKSLSDLKYSIEPLTYKLSRCTQLAWIIKKRSEFDEAEWPCQSSCGQDCVIDRIFIEDDTVHIIDYKLNYHEKQHAQLELYAKVAREFFQKKLTKTYIYDINENNLIEINHTLILS